MERFIYGICLLLLSNLNHNGECHSSIDYEIWAYLNRTTPSERHFYSFEMEHPKPVGVITTSSGLPVDIRDTTPLNTYQFKNQFHIDLLTGFTTLRIPERVVHAKGTGAWGYFQVKYDVSKYTSADIFNGIGKKTPAFGRFSNSVQNLGGNDVSRELKGLSVKFYTKEGNLDFVCLNFPMFFFKDPINILSFVNSFKRNPKTNRIDRTMTWDYVTKKSENLHAIFFLLSDYGLPNGYRKTHYFPIHTYETRNKDGDRYFVRFNFRSKQGLENIPAAAAETLSARDPDYFNRDLYDAIEEKYYPAWELEMDVLSYADVLRCNYDPFDVTRLWESGTYHTVQIGSLVFNKNPDNHFKDVELSAFNPANLVPGIPGPIDAVFRSRLFTYRSTQLYRLGINHNRIPVNAPRYRRDYNRDGLPPVSENMNDAPIYFPNSFNGPVPYVDEERPKNSLSVLHTRAVDLEFPANFYHNYVVTEEQKSRFVNNTVNILLPVAPYLQKRVLRLYSLVDPDLGKRLSKSLKRAQHRPIAEPSEVLVSPERKFTYVSNNGY